MVYSPTMNAFRLTPQEAFGQPNYEDVLKNAFSNAQSSMETAYKPSNLAEKLLDMHLQNKINAGKAKYAEQQAKADLDAKLGSIGLNPLRQRLMEAQISQAGAAGEKSKLIANLYKQFLNGEGEGTLDNNPKAANPGYEPGTGAPMYAENLQAGSSNAPNSLSAPRGNIKNDYRQALVRHLIGLPAEMPQEKMQREISSSNIKEQNKLDINRAQELRESAKDLSLAGLDINGIHDILTGPDSLHTGITRSLTGKLGFGSEKLGELNERALRLQAQMARALSQRGGVGAANIVASGKPSSWKSTSENLGITKAYAERIKNEFDLLNQEYKNISGKDLPYTLPEYVHNISNKIDKNIFKPKTEFNSEQEFHQYMNSIKPEQRKLVVKAIKESSR